MERRTNFGAPQERHVTGMDKTGKYLNLTTTHSASFTLTRAEQMIDVSQEAEARADCDTTRLLNIVNRPLGPERTLDAFKAFISSKKFAEVAQGLNEADAVKLVNAFDEVCRCGFWIALHG